jgi:hypothetical protein
MAAAAPFIAGGLIGGVVSKILAPDAPKMPLKSKDQLESEQGVKLDAFEQKGKNKRQSAAVNAGNTRTSLLGNLGGSQSPLGVNPSSSIKQAMGN